MGSGSQGCPWTGHPAEDQEEMFMECTFSGQGKSPLKLLLDAKPGVLDKVAGFVEHLYDDFNLISHL